jgi:hypothetical protein
MLRAKLIAGIAFGLAIFSPGAHAETWRLNFINGQSGFIKIDKFVFEGGKDVPAYAIPSLAEGRYEFMLGDGLFTSTPPFRDVAGFQFSNCEGGDHGNDSWLKCDAKVEMKTGAPLKRRAHNPWFLRRTLDNGKYGGVLKSIEGTFVSEDGNVRPIMVPMGWRDTVGSYRTPRVIDGIEFLNDAEAREKLLQTVPKMAAFLASSEEKRFPSMFEELASAEEKEATAQKARNHWREKYLVETKAIFEGAPTKQQLLAFTKKVPPDNAEKWSSADFDNLVPKASVLLSSLTKKEEMDARQKEQAHKDALVKVAKGTKEFCGGRQLNGNPSDPRLAASLNFNCTKLGFVFYRELLDAGWMVINVIPRQINQFGQIATMYDVVLEKQ